MEPRSNRVQSWLERKPPTSSLEEFYDHALSMVEDVYADALTHYRYLRYDEERLTPEFFMSEYVWVVFASGFNSKVLAKKFKRLMFCYSNLFYQMTPVQVDADFEYRWDEVKETIANRRKHDAIRDGVKLINAAWHEKQGNGGWWLHFLERLRSFDPFTGEAVPNLEGIEQLPGIGPITKYHLARNLGFDCVKPDLHLVRLAEYFDFVDPLQMCSFLAGLHEERIGVIDLVLFYAASTWGSKEMKR